MAWLWWLLAPVASTLLGALWLRMRARFEVGRRPARDAMAEHRALLTALSPAGAAEPAPVTMLVLDGDRPGPAPS
ncbi:MAG: hypothetical protein ACJ74U_11010 [Jatrophihabitantaceae bacterium]